MRTYSHLEEQFTGYQAYGVPGASGFSHLEVRNTNRTLCTGGGKKNGDSVITVYAYGYRRMQRLTYVSVWGGDGRSHQVPVYRDEYISVTGQGSIRIREDIDFEDSAISQRERLDHINTVLDSANLNIYRRHIAPKV